MSLWRKVKPEHTGHKGSGRKDGFYGPREEAKRTSRKARRRADRVAVSRTGTLTQPEQDLRPGEPW